MKIQKKYLELLYKVVKEYKTPKMALGRIRDKFLRDLAPQVDQYIKDREEIYKQFCIKKEDKTPDLLKGTQYQFLPEILEELNNELKTLGDEEIDVINPPELKNMIEESSYETQAGETLIIDEIIKLIV